MLLKCCYYVNVADCVCLFELYEVFFSSCLKVLPSSSSPLKTELQPSPTLCCTSGGVDAEYYQNTQHHEAKVSPSRCTTSTGDCSWGAKASKNFLPSSNLLNVSGSSWSQVTVDEMCERMQDCSDLCFLSLSLSQLYGPVYSHQTCLSEISVGCHHLRGKSVQVTLSFQLFFFVVCF